MGDNTKTRISALNSSTFLLYFNNTNPTFRSQLEFTSHCICC